MTDGPDDADAPAGEGSGEAGRSGGGRPDRREDDSGTAGTVCPFCAVGCRLAREGGRVRGRAGPANPDARLCEKGLRAFDPVEDDDRLTAPLVRASRDPDTAGGGGVDGGGGNGSGTGTGNAGADGDSGGGGGLVETTWERALDRAASAFGSIVDEDGADALAFLGAPRCTNEENYLLAKLARALGTNNVDNRARLCHAETAGRLEARLGWPATTNTIADLREADAFLVVGANPAARQPVAFDAAVRPAVDGGAALVHVDPTANETTRKATTHLRPRPGTDARVIAALCALLIEAGAVDREFVDARTTGFERFRASVLDRDTDADARAAGIDADELAAVAETIAGADRVAVLTGTGGDDAATADALLNLLLLTGNLGRPGTGLTVLRGLNNEQGATDAGCVPDRLPGHRPVTDAAARERVADEWQFRVPSEPGGTEHDLLRAFGDGVRGALVVGEDPAVSKFDPGWTRDRLDALDALVVVDPYHNETTAHADVVLPAATGVEKAGTVTNLDRQVQRLRPAADPPGRARTDFAILRSLGRRLAGDAFDYDDPGEAFAELVRVTPPYADISYEGLLDESRRWPDEEGVLYRESFETADGRARFVPAVPGDGAGGPAETGEDGDDGKPGDWGPGDGGLQLIVGDRAGSFTGGGARSGDRRVTVHPDDAAAGGIEDGDAVAVSTGATTVETTARVSDAVRPGTVYMHASAADPLVRRGSGSENGNGSEDGDGGGDGGSSVEVEVRPL